MRKRLRTIPVWAALAALVGLSTGLRFWAARAVPAPWIAPDELIYGELGRSLYAHGDFEILGGSTRFYSIVTPAVVGLPLQLSDVGLGYTLLKLLQAFVMSLAAVPVYAWARQLAGKTWALVAAVLVLALPALAYSGLIMTEVEFLPVMALASWALAAALARPTLGRQALALAAIVLAAATRLQALALGPVVVTAILLLAWLEQDRRRAVRLWPLVVGVALIGIAWAAYTLSAGGPATDVLGAYRAAGEVGYSAGAIAKFVLWHAAAVVLLVGVVPVCALAVLLARREGPPELRATVAVTLSLVVWLVIEVGVFASRHVGRLAERDLIGCAPALFVCLAAWLSRGTPRRLLPAVGAVALVATLPLGKLVSQAAVPDAFTLIPLYRLEVHYPHANLRLVGILVAAVGAAAFLSLPRRALAGLLLVALTLVSISASRVVSAQAKLARAVTLGGENRWIDRAASGPVSFLYAGDTYFSAVWESLFWNRRVDRVYDLLDAVVLGPVPQESVGPQPDGRLVTKDGRPIVAPNVLAPRSLSFVGRPLATADGPWLALWELDRPPRLARWVRYVNSAGLVTGHAEVRVYACRPGSIALELRADEPRRVTVRVDGRAVRQLRLGGWSGVVQLRPQRPGTGVCVVSLDGDGDFFARVT